MDVVVKKEKDCDWLGPSIDRTCEWCSSPDFMRGDLPRYIDKQLDEWPADLLLDLCYCFDCVQEYHRLQEELTEQRQKKVLQHLDVDRLKLTISSALGDAECGEGSFPYMQDVPLKLQVPLLEMLRFPYFLHNEMLALLFKRGLIALNVWGCPLKLEEKLPGAYLLLVHPDPEVRGWAVKSVRGQGMINPDEYDLLKEVIKWMIDVVELNLFEYPDIVTPADKNAISLPLNVLPPHLFVPLTVKEYWMGLFVLLMRMDVATVKSCFMSYTGHIGILNVIVQPMENQEGEAFWPMLQCFVVLLERLGERIWQISVFTRNPDQLFGIITKNCFFKEAILQWQTQDGGVIFKQKDIRQSNKARSLSGAKSSSGFYNTALAWFQPFVLSLLDFDFGEHYVSLVIRYLHNVADKCLTQNTFKSDVQSTLLGIIHELVNRNFSTCLAHTADLWAKDMVDFVIAETGDKKKVDVTRRLLQLLLKACHRGGSKHALKYWGVFALPGPKQLSAEEKQQIISLIEARPSFKNSVDNAAIKKIPNGSLSTQGVTRIKEEKGLQSPEEFDSNVLTARKSSDERSFRSTVKCSPSSSVSSSEGEQGVIRREKENAPQSHERIYRNGLTKRKRNDSTKKISFRSRVKPGPSSRVSSSEDEEEEEEEEKIASRDPMKRRKKPQHRSWNIKVSKMSSELDFGLMTAKIPLVDYKGLVKAEKSV
ncbi:probable helicase senataxin [Stylophora pistillata]|uniref:probable helicase senataxin n=1 Tax=Stylophora pistillata TaxID=50429 RepID=UPI000C040847|nr:probable helicase senataxin [Stylophora pistillata]